MAHAGVDIGGPHLGMGAECEAILRSLPEWFGIEQAVVDYGREVDSLPTFVASVAGQTAGCLALRLHTAYSAEVAVMALRREHHRRGIGRALLESAERFLIERGLEYLQVKTLSPSHPDPNYAPTRQFYLAVGFRPLEEFPTLWSPDNPCLLMVKALRGR